MVCASIKIQFVKQGGDISSILTSTMRNTKLPWAKYPGEMHIPGMNFAGPGTRLDLRLDSSGRPKPDSLPVDRVDEAAYRHDMAYATFPDTKTRNIADRVMVSELDEISNPTLKERAETAIIKPILSTKAKFGLGTKKNWSNQLAEELHRPVIRHFKKRKVIVRGIDHIWAADLIDMQAFAEHNDGIKYLLTIIDVFSKYGWIVPLKQKTGIAMASALQQVFRERKPGKLWVDKGKEFYNKHVRDLVDLYSTENEEKSSVVERWNRTMKECMYKYFSANSTRRYIDILDGLVDRYNNTKHGSTKMTPVEASDKSNERKVFSNLYSDDIYSDISKPKFKLGDAVRITSKKSIFDKGYTPRWTEEVFTISQVQHTDPPTYKITDTNGEEIQGSFYEQELQRTTQEIFRVEKVLKRKGNKSLVKWYGYPYSFNSWVDDKDFVR